MTACTNNGGSRARRAVTAALVGVLSVGAAPMVALADAAPVSGDVQLQAAVDPSSAKDGTIVKFEGARQEGDVFVANGKAQGLVPTEVQPFGTTDRNSRLEVTDWVVFKLCDAKTSGAKKSDDPAVSDVYTQSRTIDGKAFYYASKLTAKTLPSEVGEYAVFAVVKAADGTVVRVNEGATFSIEAAKLSDATLYQVNADDPDSTSDTTYTFNTGEWQLTAKATGDFQYLGAYNRLALKVGNTQLDMTQLTVEYYTKDGKKVAAGSLVNAGDYYMIVSGTSTGDYKGQKERFDFTIEPYDVAKANIVAKDVAWKLAGGDATTSLDTIDGEPAASSWLTPFITLDYPNIATKTGPASVTVNVNASALKGAGFDYTGSIINSQPVSYNVVDYLVTPTANYGTDTFAAVNGGAGIATDYSDDETQVFDASKVSVSYTDPVTNKKVDTDSYTLRVVNTVTNEVGGVEMLANSGTYTVEAVLDSEALGYAVAGRSAQMKVTVTKGAIASTDVAFAWNDKIVTSVTDQYLPGRDLLDEITVTVRTDNGTVPSSDYEVVVTDAKGDQVDEIVEPGTYRVQVVADGYSIDEAQSRLSVTVQKRDLAGVAIRAKNTLNWTETVWDPTVGTSGAYVEKEFRALVHTGDVLTPSYEWSVDGKTWFDLPADEVTLTYFDEKGNEVDLKDAADYSLLVEPTGDSAHFTSSDEKYTDVLVTDRKVFADVPSDAFYAQSVYDATEQGYIGGQGGTNLFAPLNDLTRADMACVLYRMAGGSITASQEDLTSQNEVTLSRFEDVDKTAYYARAVAWTTEMGITNGYGTTFGVERPITTEEFVTMLARYAAKMGTDTSVDADAVLAGTPDGDKVTGYAREAMAWAVEQGYVGKDGNELRPQENVYRGRAVTIVVRYQPTQLDVITDNPNANKPY